VHPLCRVAVGSLVLQGFKRGAAGTVDEDASLPGKGKGEVNPV
jgi:hypothetical protein